MANAEFTRRLAQETRNESMQMIAQLDVLTSSYTIFLRVKSFFERERSRAEVETCVLRKAPVNFDVARRALYPPPVSLDFIYLFRLPERKFEVETLNISPVNSLKRKTGETRRSRSLQNSRN